MQLNTLQFMAALQRAQGFISVDAGVVTFANGDTYHVTGEAPDLPADGAAPLLEATRNLAACPHDKQSVIAAFSPVTRGERNRLGEALAETYRVLATEANFPPNILAAPIKISVASRDEGVAVQTALFGLGCSFRNGVKEVFDELALSAILVGRSGVMTIELPSCHNAAGDTHKVVLAKTVLAAASVDEL